MGDVCMNPCSQIEIERANERATRMEEREGARRPPKTDAPFCTALIVCMNICAWLDVMPTKHELASGSLASHVLCARRARRHRGRLKIRW
jgi:hypothetical protein